MCVTRAAEGGWRYRVSQAQIGAVHLHVRKVLRGCLLVHLLPLPSAGEARPEHPEQHWGLGGSGAVAALQVDSALHELGSDHWLHSQAHELVWKKKTKEGCSTKCYFDVTGIHLTGRCQCN